MENNKKFFVLKRIIWFLPIQLIAFILPNALFLAIYSVIEEYITISDNILFGIIYVMAFILGAVSTYVTGRLFFKNNVEKGMVKKIVIGLLITQVLFALAVYVTGNNVIDTAIETLRQQADIKKVLLGEHYYNLMLDNTLKVLKNVCLIAIVSHVIGGCISTTVLGIKLNKELTK